MVDLTETGAVPFEIYGLDSMALLHMVFGRQL